MKKRIGAFLLAFTLALTSIVSFAEEESFTEADAETVFTEEMSEAESELEEIPLEENTGVDETEEETEAQTEEMTTPEEEETPLEDTSAPEETEKQGTETDIEAKTKAETEPLDGNIDAGNPETGEIMTDESAGGLGGTYEGYLDIDSSALPDNEELIEGYIEQVFDLSDIATIANHGEKYLSGDALAIYEYLKTAIEEIAAGERSTTSFDLSNRIPIRCTID